MDFQPRIGQNVYVLDLNNALMLCTYMGMAILKDFSVVHVYHHPSSDKTYTQDEQIGVEVLKIQSKFN